MTPGIGSSSGSSGEDDYEPYPAGDVFSLGGGGGGGGGPQQAFAQHMLDVSMKDLMPALRPAVSQNLKFTGLTQNLGQL
jgi:hypothetical protein